MPRVTIQQETEQLRQLVVAARSTPKDVGPKAEESFERLRTLFKEDPHQFTPEDIRWVNVLRGCLAVRLAPPTAKGDKPAKIAKRRGDTLEHCWRCETPIDERFKTICAECDSKAYHWRICPVCNACGCQRNGKELI